MATPRRRCNLRRTEVQRKKADQIVCWSQNKIKKDKCLISWLIVFVGLKDKYFEDIIKYSYLFNSLHIYLFSM